MMGRSRLPPILAATIATLPDKPPFSAQERDAFFAMLRCAIDVAYGSVGGPNIVWREKPPFTDDPPPIDPREMEKYIVDHDGFVMSGKTQLKFVDVPPGAVIHDLRTDDNGNRSTIVWQDCGTRLDGVLPPGVTLR